MRQSNTALPVYFDDLKVSHTHSPVVQKDDYLPFGLSFNSYSRAAITAQNFKFNAGSEVEEMTDWYSTPFRKYDPSLGRFHGVDKLASITPGINPSQYGLNNPINFNDPTGLTAAPTAYDMRGYDDPAPSAGGNGGQNDWARSRSTGSLYNNAFGSFSPNAYQHAVIKLARNIASFMNTALAGNGGYWHHSTADKALFFNRSQTGDRTALKFGANYNDLHGSWSGTTAGSYGNAKSTLDGVHGYANWMASRNSSIIPVFFANGGETPVWMIGKQNFWTTYAGQDILAAKDAIINPFVEAYTNFMRNVNITKNEYEVKLYEERQLNAYDETWYDNNVVGETYFFYEQYLKDDPNVGWYDEAVIRANQERLLENGPDSLIHLNPNQYNMMLMMQGEYMQHGGLWRRTPK